MCNYEALRAQTGSMVPLHIFEQCKRLIVLIVGDKHVNLLSIELLAGYKALLARDVVPELQAMLT